MGSYPKPRVPRGGQTRWPWTAPSNTSWWPSGQHSASAQTNRARRSAVSPKASWSLRMAARKSRVRPAQRAEWIPGRHESARTSSPESSASAGWPDARAAASALMIALAAKLTPFSAGSESPSSPAPRASTPKSESNAAISSTLPGLWLATTTTLPEKWRDAFARPGVIRSQAPPFERPPVRRSPSWRGREARGIAIP